MNYDEMNLAGEHPYFAKLYQYSTKIHFNKNPYHEIFHHLDKNNLHDGIHHLVVLGRVKF